MIEIQYTLVTDGSSDEILQFPISWLLRQHVHPEIALQARWADLRSLAIQPKGLAARVETALDLYPCDLLFIHRDAEGQPADQRIGEIRSAIPPGAREHPPYICVVPVRMQEAWLLFNEAAIRRAAGNPRGRVRLHLPSLKTTEKAADPKQILHEALRIASGLRGRRLKKFNVRQSVRQVAAFIEDYSPLRALPAFSALERDIAATISQAGWDRRN